MTSPWVSWAGALGVGALGYWYYSRPKNATAVKPQEKENSKRETSNRRQGKDESARTENQKPRKRKQPREQPPAERSTATETIAADTADDSEPEKEDTDWAQQLAAAKQGVSMTASKAAGPVGAKSTKQRDAGNLDGASGRKGPASQDVSDMLESSPAGPSAIRLTGEEKKKRQAPKKEPEPVESKKQRQNRKKNEERKALREEEERERKKLEESQRRSAREARGEPAKNGLGVAQAPANNAWAAGKSTGTNAPTHGASQPTTLLDTFDHDARSTTSSNDVTANARSPATAASLSSQNLPSEEEQMEALREMDGWAEVKGKKGKKKTSAPASPPAEPGVKEVTNHNVAHAAENVNGIAHKAPAVPNKTAPPSNPYASLEPVTKDSPKPKPAVAAKAHPEDSDWIVE